MQRFGIDVSTWQNYPNWDTVKKTDVEFAILRIGYTGSASAKSQAKDNRFDYNYENCKRVGMPIGVYYFSRATSYAEGVKEANAVLGWLKGKSLEYPVYIDVEDSVYMQGVGKKLITDAICGFCETIEKAGWYTGIYANSNWFKNYIDTSRLTQYDKWLAQWSKGRPTFLAHGLWQFGGETNYIRNKTVNGISGTVDMNYAYKDFPALMKQLGLNGYKKEEPTPPAPVEPTYPFAVGTVIYPTQDIILKSNAGYANPGLWTLSKDTLCVVNTYHDKNGLYMALVDKNGQYFSSAWTNEFDKFTTVKPIEPEPIPEPTPEPEPIEPEKPIVEEPEKPIEPTDPIEPEEPTNPIDPIEPKPENPSKNNIFTIILDIIKSIIKKIFGK